MGMFDRVHVACVCGKSNEIQSKAGECLLNDYIPSNAPREIVNDLDGEVLECRGCGQKIHFKKEIKEYLDVSFPK